uniref:Uncharacterized protein n=1 Tax=Alexandrium monilatum TaxID=311494 RepID=A0A7S4VPW8_9DINO|mmetsp:Transcript_109004/g.326020  ORF Transcript_109004/g.326020 Transcript_109004/m.326020 type:complete len:325 (-) Transcript_109004:148-1122(-)
MRGARAARLFAALAAAAVEGTVYTKLEAGAKCTDYLTQNVQSKDECFNAAAPAAGLGDLQKLEIDGIGFNGCARNTVANVVIYSVSPAVTPETSMTLPTLEYICDGVPQTTTVGLTTFTTTPTPEPFTRTAGGETCGGIGVPDVLSKEKCFGDALLATGLAGIRTMELDNIGFTGCVHNDAARMVLFGESDGVSGDANLRLPNFRYLCDGLPTTQTSTLTLTVSTTTSTTLAYTKLRGGQRCWDHQLPDVASRELCFGRAAAAVGLGDKPTLWVDGNGFTGCLYNSVAGTVLWGVSDGVTPQTTLALPMWEYLCAGLVTMPIFP